MIRSFLLFISFGLIAVSAPVSSEEISTELNAVVSPRLNLEKIQGEYLGFGIGIHPGDVIYKEAFDELDLEYVRMELGPLWHAVEERIPENASIPELKSYIERNYNGDAENRLEGAQYSHRFLRQRGIEIILIHFELPYHWRAEDGSGLFQSRFIDDLARFYTAHLLYLKENGITIDYIELANEPDGHWNGHIPPEDYVKLLKLCDVNFRENGLGKVKILGPGLAFLDLYGQTHGYMEALAQGGAADLLGGWSTHTWDEVEFLNSDPEYADGVWKPFLDGITAAKTKIHKPIFITEYGSDVTSFGERSYSSPRDKIVGSVTDSWDYAVRVTANSIIHLNRGVNVLIPYRLSNAHWHKTGWGMIQPLTREKFMRKPVFTAFSTLFSDLPTKVKVLEPTWQDREDPILATIFHDIGKQELVILATNWTEQPESKLLKLPESIKGEITESIFLCENGTDVSSEVLLENGNNLTISMKPRSMLRLKIKFQDNMISMDELESR